MVKILLRGLGLKGKVGITFLLGVMLLSLIPAPGGEVSAQEGSTLSYQPPYDGGGTWEYLSGIAGYIHVSDSQSGRAISYTHAYAGVSASEAWLYQNILINVSKPTRVKVKARITYGERAATMGYAAFAGTDFTWEVEKEGDLIKSGRSTITPGINSEVVAGKILDIFLFGLGLSQYSKIEWLKEAGNLLSIYMDVFDISSLAQAGLTVLDTFLARSQLKEKTLSFSFVASEGSHNYRISIGVRSQASAFITGYAVSYIVMRVEEIMVFLDPVPGHWVGGGDGWKEFDYQAGFGTLPRRRVQDETGNEHWAIPMKDGVCWDYTGNYGGWTGYPRGHHYDSWTSKYLVFNGVPGSINEYFELSYDELDREKLAKEGAFELLIQPTNGQKERQTLIYAGESYYGDGWGDEPEIHLSLMIDSEGNKRVAFYIGGPDKNPSITLSYKFDYMNYDPVNFSEQLVLKPVQYDEGVGVYGDYHHLVATWKNRDGVLSAALYINGVLVDNAGTGGSASIDIKFIRLGRPGKATRFYEGKMANIRIHKKFLSWGEVKLLYWKAGGDTSPPTTPKMNILPEYTNGTSCLVSWSAAQDDASGIEGYYVQYRKENEPWSDVNKIFTTAQSYLFEDLEYTKYFYRVKAKDRAGHESGWSEEVSSIQIDDNSPPTGSVDLPEVTTTRSVELTLNAQDQGAGVLYYRARNDGEDWSEWRDLTETSWTLTEGDGEKTVYVQFMDKVGNISQVFSATTRLDTTPLKGQILINDGDEYTSTTNVTLTLKSTTDEPFTKVKIKNEGDANWTEYTFDPSIETHIDWQLLDAEGEKKVYAQFWDAAGLSTPIYSDTIYYYVPVEVEGDVVINHGAEWTNSRWVTLSLRTNGNRIKIWNEDESEPDEWEVYQGQENEWYEINWQLSEGEGEKTVHVKYGRFSPTGEIESTFKTMDSIKLDLTPPTGSITDIEGRYGNTVKGNEDNGWIITNYRWVKLELSASDSLSGVAEVRFKDEVIRTYGLESPVETGDWSEWEPFTPTKYWQLLPYEKDEHYEHRIYVEFRDKAGNTFTFATHERRIYLDTIPPSGSIVINDDAPAVNTPSVTLKITAQGAAEMRLGNAKRALYSPWISWEAAQPVLEANLAILEPGIDIAVVEPGDVLSQIQERTRGGVEIEWQDWEPYQETKSWQLSEGEGEKTVYVLLKDEVGNVSTLYSDSITLDSTPPAGTLVINDGAIATNSREVTLSLYAEDNLTGVAKMRFAEVIPSELKTPLDLMMERYMGKGIFKAPSDIEWSDWEGYQRTKLWELSQGEGQKEIWVQFMDGAGNVSPSYSATIYFDITPPTGEVLINEGDFQTGSPQVELSLSATDNLSGVAEMQLTNFLGATGWKYVPWESFSPVKPWELQPGPGRKEISVRFKDAAGNISERYSDAILLDTLFSDSMQRLGHFNDVVLADINSDGRLDLLVTELEEPWGLRAFINAGDGEFISQGDALIAENVYRAVMGDLDNDGDLDIVAVPQYSSPYEEPFVRIYLNDGSGQFTSFRQHLDYAPDAVLGDIDNDGDLDVISTTAVYINRVDEGGLEFERKTYLFEIVGASKGVRSLALGDIDDDGDIDLLAGYRKAPEEIAVEIFSNDGNGEFTPVTELPSSHDEVSERFPLILVDIDEDGDLDLMYGTQSETVIWLNDGQGTFSPFEYNPFYDLRGLRSINPVDIDNDGHLDLVFNDGSYIKIALSWGMRVIESMAVMYYPLHYQCYTHIYSTQGLALGDVDDDRDIDMIIGEFGGYLGFHPETPSSAVLKGLTSLTKPNSPPSPPTALHSSVEGDRVILNWAEGSDAEIPHILTYNLRVGTTPGGNEIVSSAIPAGPGNMGHSLKKLLKGLPPGTYYWSVQTIDAGFARSGWAVEQSFTLAVPVPGDVNGDGVVDAADLGLVAAAFGSTSESPDWNPDADLNKDGRVDIFDLVIVGVNFGRSSR